MKGRHETLGVLYVDTHSNPRDFVDNADKVAAPHHMPTGKFSEDSLHLAIAIAHQAALAVEDTRYHEALVQAERLAAVGQTIAALSHHIKNILQGLRSGGDIIKMGLSEGKADYELLQQGWKIVEKNQAKIYDLVMDMLNFSKEREPAIESADVNGIVRDVVELMANRAQSRGVKLEARLTDDLPACEVDPEGIHKALLNIVGNALDAVEDRKNPPPQVVVATQFEQGKDDKGDWVRVFVVDNGVGIPTEQQSEIFRPFKSTKGARGTGLGLAVSRKILREHGGDIHLQSQAGKGSRFVLRFPVKSPVAPDPNTITGNMPRFEE
jgi:signal transduction histidine kinase